MGFCIVRLLAKVFALAFFFCCGTAQAAHTIPQNHSWHVTLFSGPASPNRVLAVDKKTQNLTILQGQTALSPVRNHVCTTGKQVGDKWKEGDLKTPEGVYFVSRHITSGLDFLQYGNEAYTLNYPNPVDKLRKKTGSGIWIHGRGEPIVPLMTRGCVSLENGFLKEIGPLLKSQTPIVLAETVAFSKESTASLIKKQEKVRQLSEKWAELQQKRSSEFFKLYDSEAYSKSTQSFATFKKNHENIFRSKAKTTLSISKVQVLQGPGYWVSWFTVKQTGAKTASGVRRLYWAEDASGAMKIIGTEWVSGASVSTSPVGK